MIRKVYIIIFLFYSISLNALMLDDMEDGNNQNNWGGYWYTYDDLGSSGDSYVVPWSEARWLASGQTAQPFYMQSPGRTDSGYAARMTGYVTTTFQYGFVGMGTSFIDPKGPVDLSTCTGITLWIKGDGKTYRMKISSAHPNFTLGEADNHYGYAFVSTSEWTQLDILMSSLTQESGWGSSVNLSDALSMATDIQFQTMNQPHNDIELWVDEIDIYGCITPPVTETPTFTATPTWTATQTQSCSCPSWFGKKVQGAYSYDFSGFFNACKYRMLEDGNINSISVNFASTSGGQARVALYTDNGGTPGNLIVESASEIISESGWHTFYVSDIVLNTGIYWIAIQTEMGVILRLDTIAANNEVYYSMPYGPFPSVAGAGGVADGAYDIYVDYCPLVCPSPTVVITPVVVCDCPAVMGKQYDGGINSSTIAGYMAMNWYGMGENGIAQSISVRIDTGSGNLMVALYDDVAGEPGRLLVQSASTAVTTGWNEIDIDDIMLEAGKVYWIAMQSDNSSINIGRDTGSNGDERYMAYPYKDFPEISLMMNSYSNNWDIRVNYCPLTCPPTPTLTPTETEVVTYTETPTITETSEITDTYTPTITMTETLTETYTATHTETPTWTNTPTFTITPTWTITSIPGIPSPTPGERFKFDNTKPLLVYPNPYNVKTKISIDFYLLRPAELIYFRLYTPAGRLIREMPYIKNSPNISNNLIQGKNTLQIEADNFKDLAQGIYYFVLIAEDNTKKQTRSKIEKIIILK